MAKKRYHWLLLLAVLVVATCGLIYELVAGTLASYLLGDSVTQFSTIIGTYLFAMGVGSYLSRYFEEDFLFHFVTIEIMVGIIGGFSPTLLFYLFSEIDHFRIALYGLVACIGVLVGLEIPLMMRLLKEKVEFKELVSEIFTFDYIGSLLASILFPLFFIPKLGIVKTGFFFGMINVVVAIALLWVFWDDFGKKRRSLRMMALGCFLVLLGGFVYGDRLLDLVEQRMFNEKVVYSKSSPYQRIVVTKHKNETRLYLNNNLQFSSLDEYRYHESLVHPAMGMSENIEQVLVLGGGDGMAVREVLKYPEVKKITLVDLDPQITILFKSSWALAHLNGNSLSHPKVAIENKDAFDYVKGALPASVDIVIIDFPDPSNYSVGKLYTNLFYRCVRKLLKDKGVMVVQTTSPLMAPKSFQCVVNTISQVGFATVPYHCYLPSFGEWGFILASQDSTNAFIRPQPSSLRYFSQESFPTMKQFSEDMKARHSLVQKLSDQQLVALFEEEWNKFN
jgi:spermidine synthase